ncbi:PEP/pyruvate-binding domain-containing protein [Coraliomargarita akajimensis]|uniref:Pyruvate phosphate dikinase PEP/pyruvate-binding protein n=1 Tax=Coraliomargarita akajimensis (strain DSM 45221 / IAM 15411 / JCM 23193 / KCTC 12865 / 04OKA010-24) TaxID=583355 RepID=D5ELQ4_CORAD|nr:PEP/pyruvate-binding domain-containing protein [Coraliomargarita akajimensis]ADE53229.1 pyruvate phosphate dikinase PEP/pyruvate- binding protein [Coraliomargarita akajimensis DSM 45221]
MSDSNPYLLSLKDAHDATLVGGKAINLAKLLKAGLPVPNGFVVTTKAFKDSTNGKLSELLGRELRLAIQEFKGARVAVRSSATAEDLGDASMAGQYESYLNLQTEAQILEAIERCWASLRSARTEAYLCENGIDINEVAMAVVVQQQVSADSAGVLFTVNPQTGARDQMLIEACWGLGETLVSGEIHPDKIWLSSATTEVLDYQIGSKEFKLKPGSTELEAVDPERRQKACLTFSQIDRLRELGEQAEQYFGKPQDIEWAIEADTVYVVQTRAITTLAETDCSHRLLAECKEHLTQRAAHGAGPWVRHNLGETLPHPTPLTWSLIAAYMSGSGGFGKMYTELGFKPGPAVHERSFLERIAGEIYMDCSLMTEMFGEAYPYAYDTNLLRDNPDAAQSPPSVPQGSIKALGDAAKIAQGASERIEELAKDLDSEFDLNFVPAVQNWVQEQSSIDLSSLSDADLIKLWKQQCTQVLDNFAATAFLPSMVEAVAMDKLRQAVEAHVWQHDSETVLARLCVSPTPDCTLAGTIDLQKLSPEAWLQRYGHRTTAEFELANPRWSEQADKVERLKEQLGTADLESTHQQRRSDAESCLIELKQTLSTKAFAEIEAACELVQRYLRFREDGKFHLIKAYSQLRYTALEMGERLGLQDRVFFLTSEELCNALATSFVPEDRIRTRSLEYQVETRIQTAHLIEPQDIARLGEAIIRQDGDSFKAHSVSSGTCQGEARIVRDPTHAPDFEPGSILVCPSTDPSWTPLFAKASGLILERGGTLSHGAVVAREMGLPAVVLESATERFTDGDILSIDANSGAIYRGTVDTETAPHLDATQRPPSASRKERQANHWGLFAALVWGVLLGATFLLPPHILKDPAFRLLDTILWPLIRAVGMAGTVAVVAAVFGLLPVVGQRLLTDNARLFAAKQRAGRLRKAAAKQAAGSEARKAMEAMAAPVTMRILKASMVPLALILGPMILIFMWFPARVDPASWNAEPGRMVSIVAEVDGECTDSVSLTVPAPLHLSSEPAQNLPNIRQELEELRAEWTASSDLSSYPWEIQSAADQTRLTMLASLNAYLKAGIPAQKLSWLLDVPETAQGSFPVVLRVGETVIGEFNLVFGQSSPPEPSSFTEFSSEIQSLQINYPRALQKAQFFTVPGLNKDIGWLGVYLALYLPVMFLSKTLLRVP